MQNLNVDHQIINRSLSGLQMSHNQNPQRVKTQKQSLLTTKRKRRLVNSQVRFSHEKAFSMHRNSHLMDLMRSQQVNMEANSSVNSHNLAKDIESEEQMIIVQDPSNLQIDNSSSKAFK